MTISAPFSDPGMDSLKRDLDALADSLRDFKDALFGINDIGILDKFLDAVETADIIVAHHRQQITLTVVDDIANLRSQLARHRIPRDDPDLGRVEWLQRLRAARGAVLADFELVLETAQSYGFAPTVVMTHIPTSIEFERAGLSGMLAGLERRLSEVENALQFIEPEGDRVADHSPQQIGLVGFYLQSMANEVALARLEAAAKRIVDFANLARAIEVMGELTQDFVATVRGLRDRVTLSLKSAAERMRPLVGRLTKGMRTIVKRVERSQLDASVLGGPDLAPPTSASVDSRSTKRGGPSGADAVLTRRFEELMEIGDRHLSVGEFGKAEEAFQGAHLLAQEASAALPADSSWRHNLSVVNDRLGELAEDVGDLTQARRHFEAGLSLDESLARGDPDNTEWKRNLLVSYNRLGDLSRTLGNLDDAHRRYEVGLAIAEKLAAQEPSNLLWQRDLSISHEHLGDLAHSKREFQDARQHYEESLQIVEQLAVSQPDNDRAQRDLAVIYDRLGDVALALRDFEEARRRFEGGLEIRERLAALNPENAELQRDLSVSFSKLGTVARAAGDLVEARRRYEADLALAQQLAARESRNARLQRDLYSSHGNLAETARAAGDTAEALAHFRAAEAVIKEVATRWPDHPGFARDLEMVRKDIQDAERQSTG